MGEIEIPRYRVMGNSEYLLGAEKWKGLRSVGMIELEKRVNGKIKSIEQRYYLLSFECDVKRFADVVRHYWSIENQLHWVLDVSFGEDARRGCQGYSFEMQKIQ